jgi:hypothetical protein
VPSAKTGRIYAKSPSRSTKALNTPSAVGERQILPRHTNRIFIKEGLLTGAISKKCSHDYSDGTKNKENRTFPPSASVTNTTSS